MSIWISEHRDADPSRAHHAQVGSAVCGRCVRSWQRRIEINCPSLQSDKRQAANQISGLHVRAARIRPVYYSFVRPITLPRCLRCRTRDWLESFFPCVTWIQTYKWRVNALADIIAGWARLNKSLSDLPPDDRPLHVTQGLPLAWSWFPAISPLPPWPRCPPSSASTGALYEQPDVGGALGRCRPPMPSPTRSAIIPIVAYFPWGKLADLESDPVLHALPCRCEHAATAWGSARGPGQLTERRSRAS